MRVWTPPTQTEVDGYFDRLNNWGRWGAADQVDGAFDVGDTAHFAIAICDKLDYCVKLWERVTIGNGRAGRQYYHSDCSPNTVSISYHLAGVRQTLAHLRFGHCLFDLESGLQVSHGERRG